ncbi:hypothetical protein GCM10007938_08220 [Vibrio zhanjiangensis]|uniref:Uncharacterized protein n=1 Tax=Vibrio zhanjiangensis TaxID=1046128 RepID=A0ABQ6EX10_9VIBR|nr:hypothetical protein [Vibrio zhanjiangensis]GLT17045.1 hypothetical protein GCM10007938_08220 [Vibrio zhanjiangensis]
MKKSEAMRKASVIYGVDFQSSNTHFSKINKSLPVWWLEVSLKKVNSTKIQNLFFLLEDGDSIHLLNIPTKFLRKNKSGFYTRKDNDKDHICFRIDVKSYRELMGTKRQMMKEFMVLPPSA